MIMIMKAIIISYLLSCVSVKSISTNIIKKSALNCHNSYIAEPFPETNAYLTRNSSKCRLFEAFETKDEDLHVNFCGSRTAQDWIINSDLILRNDAPENYKFHSGFLKSVNTIEESDEYLRVKDRVLYCNNIVFSGHSKGAAIASLMALRLSKVFKYSKIKLVTFAITNIATSEFFDQLEETVEQAHYIFEDDFICQRGFGDLSFKYKTFLNPYDDSKNVFEKHNMKRYIHALNAYQ